MPTAAPQAIPAAMLPAGPLNQFDWIDAGNQGAIGGALQSSLMRGNPGAMAFWQRRQIRGPETTPQGAPYFLTSRPYSRGAGAHAPKFGQLAYNPIGAGVVAPYRLPTIAGPGARYEFAAIWFDVQTIPTSIAPSPTMSMDSVAALLATSSVSAMYATTG
jgi:hypothetical protein